MSFVVHYSLQDQFTIHLFYKPIEIMLDILDKRQGDRISELGCM